MSTTSRRVLTYSLRGQSPETPSAQNGFRAFERRRPLFDNLRDVSFAGAPGVVSDYFRTLLVS